MSWMPSLIKGHNLNNGMLTPVFESIKCVNDDNISCVNLQKKVFVPDNEECLGWIGSNAIFSGHSKDLSLGGNKM